MNIHERLKKKAELDLIKLYVEREDARKAGIDERKLTQAMMDQKTRISELKGQLIRQQPKESSWMTA